METQQQDETVLREPSKLSFESQRTRRSILASYWIVIFLALPFWWHTTSIERLSLPSARVRAQVEKELAFPVTIDLDATNSSLDIQSLKNDFRQLQKPVLLSSQRWKGIDMQLRLKEDRGTQVVPIPGTYSVAVGKAGALGPKRQLTISENDVPSLLEILSRLVAPYHTSVDSDLREQRVVQYAARYRLAFSLLNEDASLGQTITGWDVDNAIAEYLSPTLSSLSVLHNFTIESQVQLHAPLAFAPQPVTVGNDSAHGLSQEDLTVFINSAHWTLSSSVSNDPVLHFVLFVPSSTQKPLYILDDFGSPTDSSSFLLPQWGGVFILNIAGEAADKLSLSRSHLQPVFSAFRHQLLALLGVPPIPAGMNLVDDDPLSDWQLDAVLRRRALEATQGAQETLYSIVKLVEQIDNMPVGQHVKGDVQDALTALEQVYKVSPSSPTLALRWSSEAFSLASRAFFNPGMLALLYFPAEHKYAVYTPLFASITFPLVVALGREILAWWRDRRQQSRR
ncbi:hypothetical protein SERLA73DRAFT_98679 [Serpula lacrymans var. lacrymans S7.3]|uniref:GPI transamidase component PIG-S n=2 Tax=Serpula lacrymans var. lacrymans TaxID=341189 RepID=F8QFR0_SERL3|nr:uncharacterized protein SERLADRAFT_457890 [Serpula lacrymans var. lacrymans S7.9]EGN92894.1 hypothetical protein SERLA73DRAFT_98679 [Serpula lacrymans var. lacrymans S7.3]EGO29724.1 hypothetical protein SERLADRAFT_457890 [Serpula lacrymans var. lacrymans S7.9]